MVPNCAITRVACPWSRPLSCNWASPEMFPCCVLYLLEVYERKCIF
jgi:hypothetical protein